MYIIYEYFKLFFLNIIYLDKLSFALQKQFAILQKNIKSFHELFIMKSTIKNVL